jgi:hypothetical protein
LNLVTKIKDPTLALAKPEIIKEIPNSVLPKLQAETKAPTNTKIAPKTQVSKALTTQQITVTSFKALVISPG